MKKTPLLNLILAILLPFLFSCEKEVDAPQPDFSVSQSTSASEITVTFTDLSSNSPDEWLWTFEGGIPSTSTEKNPSVMYTTSGTFDVKLIVKNDGGENELLMYDYINVVQFNNPLFTDIDITVDYVTKTVSPDSYVRFIQIDNVSVSYIAETSGKTDNGTVVGEEIYWDQTVDLSSYSSYNLILNSDFIFFYITNSSDYNLNPFYVNFDDYYETMDNILIPNDGVKYSTGYYYTNYGMEVRAYYQYYSDYWVYWYIYPDSSNNQYWNLTYSKSSKGQSENAIDFNLGEPEMLYPAIEAKSKTVFDTDAKDLAPSNKK